MIRNRFHTLALALTLIGILAFLVMKAQAVDVDAINKITATLRSLRQVDAEWNLDVLRSKTGLRTDYDAVARAFPRIRELEESIRKSTADSLQSGDAGAQAILPHLNHFIKLMAQKIAMIERFKSQHAILQNSSRFLPVAATDFSEVTRASNANLKSKAQIDEALNDLLTSTMIYSFSPEPTLNEKIKARTQALRQLTSTSSDDVRGHLEILIAHVQTIVKQQAIGPKLLADLDSLPTAKAIDMLSNAYAAYHEKQLDEQSLYRQMLVACLLLLLIASAYVGRRVYMSYRDLDRRNASLLLSNQESQSQLRHAEKMSALGQMAAGIAHEINTPLAYMKGTFHVVREQLDLVSQLAKRTHEFAQLLSLPDSDKTQFYEQLKGIETLSRDVVENRVFEEMNSVLKDGIYGIDQISEIVMSLKDFSRFDRAKVDNFSVQEGLANTLKLARHMMKNKIEVRTYYRDVPKISCSPSQINQVFLNIITNAVHAMIDTSSRRLMTLSTSMEGDDMVRIDIQDTGGGIPRDVLPKIFDPFFTTKAIHQGTGLGLTISYKIIQEHGGQITVESEDRVGSIFSILLPIRAVDMDRSPIDSELLQAA